MISIIVCSAKPLLLQNLRLNIEATIGCSFEWLAYDNSFSNKSIAAVYNEQSAKANFDLLCYLHEDIVIHSEGWGKVLSKVLGEKTIGLVGISGSVYKSTYPGTWAACESNLYRTHSIQHFKTNHKPVVTNINPHNELFSEVAVIDGVFMATRKDVFEQFRFDEVLLKGFHGYDLDYSLQVNSAYKVVVSYEILLEHLSEGAMDKAWLDTSFRLHEKWKSKLPIAKITMQERTKITNDYIALCCALGVALSQKGYKRKVLHFYSMLLTKFLHINKLRYGKTVLNYLLSS